MITPCFALSGHSGLVGCELEPSYPGRRTQAVVPRPSYPGRRTQGGASLYHGLAHVAPLGRKGQRPEARIVICEDS